MLSLLNPGVFAFLFLLFVLLPMVGYFCYEFESYFESEINNRGGGSGHINEVGRRRRVLQGRRRRHKRLLSRLFELSRQHFLQSNIITVNSNQGQMDCGGRTLVDDVEIGDGDEEMVDAFVSPFSSEIDDNDDLSDSSSSEENNLIELHNSPPSFEFPPSYAEVMLKQQQLEQSNNTSTSGSTNYNNTKPNIEIEILGESQEDQKRIAEENKSLIEI